MLSIDPVERLSSTATSWPSASSRSARCEPMNPAPPVIRTFMAAREAISAPRDGRAYAAQVLDSEDHCARHCEPDGDDEEEEARRERGLLLDPELRQEA